jgi:hypothetical protein
MERLRDGENSELMTGEICDIGASGDVDADRGTATVDRGMSDDIHRGVGRPTWAPMSRDMPSSPVLGGSSPPSASPRT